MQLLFLKCVFRSSFQKNNCCGFFLKKNIEETFGSPKCSWIGRNTENIWIVQKSYYNISFLFQHFMNELVALCMLTRSVNMPFFRTKTKKRRGTLCSKISRRVQKIFFVKSNFRGDKIFKHNYSNILFKLHLFSTFTSLCKVQQCKLHKWKGHTHCDKILK